VWLPAWLPAARELDALVAVAIIGLLPISGYYSTPIFLIGADPWSAVGGSRAAKRSRATPQAPLTRWPRLGH